MLGKHRIVAGGVPLDGRTRPRVARVPGGDERVPLQPALVVPRHVETSEAVDVTLEPLDEVDVRGVVDCEPGPSPLHPPIPRADVLADVAAVDLRVHRLAVFD